MGPTRSSKFMIVCLAIVLFLLAGCGSGSRGTATNKDETLEPGTESSQFDQADQEVAADLELNFVNYVIDEYQDMLVTGMIRNIGDQNVGNAVIQIDLFNTTEELLDSEFLGELASGLGSGQSFPFSVVIYDPPQGVMRIEATVNSAQVMPSEAAPLTFENVAYSEQANGVVQVVGEIVNPGQDSVMVSLIRGAELSRDEKYLIVFSCNVCPRSIDAGGSAPFSMLHYEFYGLPRLSGNFELYGSAVVEPFADSIDLNIADSQFSYVDEMGTFHVVGEVVNLGDVPLQASLIAGLYSGEGSILAASKTSVHPEQLFANETGYFDLKFEGSYREEFSPDTALTWKLNIDWVSPRYEVADTSRIKLETREESIAPEGEGVIVSGYVVNTTDQKIGLVDLTVILKDMQRDLVVCLENVEIPGPLNPGDGVPYSLLLLLPSEINPGSLIGETVVFGSGIE